MKSSTAKIFKLFQQGFAYSLGNFFNKFLLFLMIPLYAEFILPSDLSLLEILDPLEQFVYGVLNLGMVHAFYRYYEVDGEPDYQRKVISTLFWFLSLMAIIVCIIFAVFADTLVELILPAHSLAKTCFLLTLASLFIRYFSLSASGYLNKTEQATKYSIWNIAGTFLFCSYNFYFLAIEHQQIDAVFEARILSMLPVTIAGIWSFRRVLAFTFDFKMLKHMLKFSYPFILSAASYPILTYVDRWMLSKLASPKATGIYGMSYRFGMIPGMILVQPFLKAWRPFIHNYNDRETQQVVYKRILLYYGLIGCMLWIGLSVLSYEIIVLFTSKAYFAGNIIIPYVASSQLLYGLGWIVIAGLAVQDKTFFIGFCTFLAGILNVILNYYWIPIFGILGAAYATLVSFLGIFLGYAIYSYRQLPLSWPYSRLIAMVVISIGTYYVSSFISVDNFWVQIIYKLLSTLPALIILTFLAGLNPWKLSNIGSHLTNGFKDK